MKISFYVTICIALEPWPDMKLLGLAANWRRVSDNDEAGKQGISWNRAREATIISDKRSLRKVSAPWCASYPYRWADLRSVKDVADKPAIFDRDVILTRSIFAVCACTHVYIHIHTNIQDVYVRFVRYP